MRGLLIMLKLKLGSGWLWPKWPMHWWPNMCSEKVTPQRFQSAMISISLQLHEVAFARRDVGSWWWLLWTQVITHDRFRLCYLYISTRCTPDHPCTHGEGHCKSDSDCERSGYHICGAACIGLLSKNIWSYLFRSGPTFDTKHFPNNTDIKYSPSDMCCVRRWEHFSFSLQSLLFKALAVTQS